MIPIWIWDYKNKAYIALPAPPRQFGNGNWGWTRDECVSDLKVWGFIRSHPWLINHVPYYEPLAWRRVELKLKPPTKGKWWSKGKARVTKVQR